MLKWRKNFQHGRGRDALTDVTNGSDDAVTAAVTASAMPSAPLPPARAAADRFARGRFVFPRNTEAAAAAAAGPPSPEQALVQRARQGDAGAFDALFLQHKDGVYACLWNLLDGDADLVDDAVGGVFLSAYRSLPRFRGDAAFSTWLYRIAVNEAHARRRQKGRWLRFGMIPVPEQTPAAAPGDPGEGGDPADQVVRSDTDKRLRRAVSVLPEPYRTPIILRYLSGMDSVEIAQVLGRPAGTVRYQISRALRMLRERLGEEWPE